MNIRIGIGVLSFFFVLLVVGIAVTIIGSFQDDLTTRLVTGDTLNEEGKDSLESNTSRFPSLFDTAILLVSMSIVAGTWYLSYLFGRPGLSLIVGVLFLFLTVWMSGTIELLWRSLAEQYVFASEMAFTDFLLSNLDWVASGVVVGGTIASTLSPGGSL